jgi:hypothetical protein
VTATTGGSLEGTEIVIAEYVGELDCAPVDVTGGVVVT